MEDDEEQEISSEAKSYFFTAEKTKMSIASVVNARRELEEKDYIRRRPDGHIVIVAKPPANL